MWNAGGMNTPKSCLSQIFTFERTTRLTERATVNSLVAIASPNQNPPRKIYNPANIMLSVV